MELAGPAGRKPVQIDALAPCLHRGSSATLGCMDEITFRPITEADSDFLLRVYSSTRTEELAMVPWTEDQKAAFCRMQFHAQHTHYQQHYSDASFDVMERGGVPIGRLYVQRTAVEVMIIDITLLPEFRRAGLGTKLLRDLQEEARTAGKTLTIYVEKFNPAQRLYQRLGFQQTADEGVYLRMEWRAP